MVFLDTSLLIDGLTGTKNSGQAILRALARGERLFLSSVALYEWLRGPRTAADLAIRRQSDLPIEFLSLKRLHNRP